jgi:hypothetical protein
MRRDALQKEYEADDTAAAAVAMTVLQPSAGSAAKGPSTSAALARVQNMAHVAIVKQKVGEVSAGCTTTFNEIEAKVKEDFHGGLSDGLNAALNDVRTKLTDVKDGCEAAATKLLQASADIDRATQVEFMRINKAEADQIMKTEVRPPQKVFCLAASALKRTMNAILRKKVLASGAGASVVALSVATIPLAAVGQALIEAGAISQTSSFLEAKMGLRAAVVAPGLGDPATLIAATAKAKKAHKDILNHLKTSKFGIVPVLDTPSIKRIVKELKKAFDPCLFAQLVLPDQDWAPKVYSPQYFGASESYAAVNCNHFGCMDCRMLFAGEEVLIGVPITAGCDLKALRRQIFASTVDELRVLVNNGGWAIKHDSTHVAIIPSGFLVVQLATTAIWGVRWSIASDADDLERVKRTVTILTQLYPEITNASTGYCQWLQWLQTM